MLTRTSTLAGLARVAALTAMTLLIAVAAGLIWLHAHGQHLLSVQSASMVPTFQRGDALVVEPVQPGQLRAGDIISYRSNLDPSVIISHRLTKIDHAGRLTTAGDALGAPDPPITPAQVIGRATAVAPKLGRLTDWLRKPLGLVLAVYLPALVVVASEIRRLIKHQDEPTYRLRFGNQC